MGAYTRDAGRVRLTVASTDTYTSDDREVWEWQIVEVRDDGTTRFLEAGKDLRTGVGMTATPEQMMGTLCVFLSAAAESSHYAMRHGENGTLFSHDVLMLAEENSDEIVMLAVELEEGETNA